MNLDIVAQYVKGVFPRIHIAYKICHERHIIVWYMALDVEGVKVRCWHCWRRHFHSCNEYEIASALLWNVRVKIRRVTGKPQLRSEGEVGAEIHRCKHQILYHENQAASLGHGPASYHMRMGELYFAATYQSRVAALRWVLNLKEGDE